MIFSLRILVDSTVSITSLSFRINTFHKRKTHIWIYIFSHHPCPVFLVVTKRGRQRHTKYILKLPTNYNLRRIQCHHCIIACRGAKVQL